MKILVFFILLINIYIQGDEIVINNGELVKSQFKSELNSNLPWCKKKFLGQSTSPYGYKTDKCYAEVGYFTFIYADRYYSPHRIDLNKIHFFTGYAGEWLDDKPHGKGIRIKEDSLIIGNWHHGNIDYGIIEYFDKDTDIQGYRGINVKSDIEHFIYGKSSDFNTLRKVRNVFYKDYGYEDQIDILFDTNNFKDTSYKLKYEGSIGPDTRVPEGHRENLVPNGTGILYVTKFSNAIYDHVYPSKIEGIFIDGKVSGNTKYFFKNQVLTIDQSNLPQEVEHSFNISCNSNKKRILKTKRPILLESSDQNIIKFQSDKELLHNLSMDKPILIKNLEENSVHMNQNSYNSLSLNDSKKLLETYKVENVVVGDFKKFNDCNAKRIPSLIALDKEKNVLVYSSQGLYEGLIKIDNNEIIKDGFGIMEFLNGTSYEGKWKNNKKNGLMVFTDNKGNKNEEEWVNGLTLEEYRKKLKEQNEKIIAAERKFLENETEDERNRRRLLSKQNCVKIRKMHIDNAERTYKIIEKDLGLKLAMEYGHLARMADAFKKANNEFNACIERIK
jgi:hypothetical protein